MLPLLALLLLLLLGQGAEAAPLFTVAFTVVEQAALQALPIVDQHLLIANKALTQPYARERELCPQIDFAVAQQLPPAKLYANNTYFIAYDLRPSPTCQLEPANAIWPPGTNLTGLISPQIKSDCTYANAHNVFSLGRPVNLSVEILFNGLAALKWTNVVLLNTARCSWNQLPADIRTAVEVYSEQYNITVHGNNHSDARCRDLPMENLPIMLLIITNVEDAAALLIYAYQQGWLDTARAIVYNSALSYADFTMLSQFMTSQYGSLGIDVVERFKAIAVHIGSFPGRYDMARRIQRFRDQWGQTGPPALPASVMETSVWEVATIVRYIILSRRCPALNFQPSLSWPDDPYAAAYITRLSESGPAIIRGSLADLSGETSWQFFDLLGAPVQQPQLLLEARSSIFPVAKLPVALNIALISDLPLSSHLQTTLLQLLEPNGAVGRFASHLRLNPVFISQVDTSCQDLAQQALLAEPVAILAIVSRSCALPLATAFKPYNLTLVFVGQGFPVEGNSSFPHLYSVLAPRSSPLQVVLQFLAKVKLPKAVVITEDADSVTLLDSPSGRQAAVSLPALLLNSSQTHQPWSVCCTPDTYPIMFDLLSEAKTRRSPVIVVDIAPAALNCFFFAANKSAMLGPPYFYILTLSPARALPLVSAEVRRQLAHRLVFLSDDRGGISDATFATAVGKATAEETGLYHSGLVGMAVMSHFTLLSAARRSLTFSFGTDTNITRQQLLAGFNTISTSRPVEGLLQTVVFFQERMVYSPMQLMTLGDQGTSPTAFALSQTSSVAVVDTVVFDRIQLPQPADYALLEADQDGAGHNAASSSSDTRLLGLIAIAAVAIIVLLAFAAARKRRQSHRMNLQRNSASRLDLVVDAGSPPALQWIAPERLLVQGKPLGQGTLGTVHLAMLDRKDLVVVKCWKPESLTAEPVAVKEMQAQLRRECETLAHLSSVPQVLRMFGVVGQDPDVHSLVVEHCPRGDLHSLLRQRVLPVALLAGIASDVAAGMAAVIPSGAVHLELCARHVYITEDLHAKLGCFGMPAAFGKYFEVRLRLPNIRWCAPELFRGSLPSPASNVWAFGVLLYEMATNGAIPFPDLTSVQVRRAVLEGKSPQLPPYWPEELKMVARACLQSRPSDRPNFEWLQGQLEAATRHLYVEHLRDEEMLQGVRSSREASRRTSPQINGPSPHKLQHLTIPERQEEQDLEATTGTDAGHPRTVDSSGSEDGDDGSEESPPAKFSSSHVSRDVKLDGGERHSALGGMTKPMVSSEATAETAPAAAEDPADRRAGAFESDGSTGPTESPPPTAQTDSTAMQTDSGFNTSNSGGSTEPGGSQGLGAAGGTGTVQSPVSAPDLKTGAGTRSNRQGRRRGDSQGSMHAPLLHLQDDHDSRPLPPERFSAAHF